MNIPMARPAIGLEEAAAVNAVLLSGVIAQGKKVEEFEARYADFVGSEYAVAVGSGTAALHLSLLAHGIGEGDEVITTPFSFIATANSILFARARPIFVDIDYSTFNIDASLIEQAITPKTKAIMPVHLYGQPAAMDEILRVAKKHRLVVLEDACQAHGAEYQNSRTGSFGTGSFSFYPTKNMTTSEGGIITTSDPEVAERARMYRSHGSKKRYFHETLGFNFRMTDIAASIGLIQLNRLERFNDLRRRNAELYNQGLKNITGLVTPFCIPEAKHVWHQYTIRITKEFGVPRDAVREKLSQRGIASEVYYPLAIHHQPLYKQLGCDYTLPKAEQAAREVLSLPVYPGISREEVSYIVSAIKEIKNGG